MVKQDRMEQRLLEQPHLWDAQAGENRHINTNSGESCGGLFSPAGRNLFKGRCLHRT
jgi:hypothetical protein